MPVRVVFFVCVRFFCYLVKLPETNWMSTDLFFGLVIFLVNHPWPFLYFKRRNPNQSLPVQTTSLPPYSQSYVCCVTHSSASHNAPVRDWKLFLFNSQVFLFLLMVSPETIYLYVVYVDLEMIENQCPLRLTCNRCGISDLNFARSKNTRFKTFNFKEFMQTKKLNKETFVQN